MDSFYKIFGCPKIMCSWCAVSKILIHRFDIGSRICRCGQITVDKKETTSGWKYKVKKQENGGKDD